MKKIRFNLIAVHISPMKFLSCIFLSLLIISPTSAANRSCEPDDPKGLYCPVSDRGYSWRSEYNGEMASIWVIGRNRVGVRADSWSKGLVLPATFNGGGSKTGLNDWSNWNFDVRAPGGEWHNVKVLEVHYAYRPYSPIGSPTVWDIVTVTGKLGSYSYQRTIR